MTQTIIPIRQAQTTLEQQVRRAAQGESIFIGDNGEAEAVLSLPPSRKRTQRRLGHLAGKLHVPDDFDAPLPPDILAAFYGAADGEKRP